MEKINDWEKVEAKGMEDFKSLPIGAYECVIKEANVHENKDTKKKTFRVAVDIASGDYKNYYQNRYDSNNNSDKKWDNNATRYLAFEGDNIAYFNCQDVEDEFAYGMEILHKFIDEAKDFKREEVDFSELFIGLKCGGSDGYSGLTANPLVGKISDRVVAAGGGAILTEVPEMFGAEQLLMNKCRNVQIFEKYKKMIEDFKAYYTNQGFPVYENPSPGNKKGGITTLEEKSLGCIEKAGSTEIMDVLAYGERIPDAQNEGGVYALNAPGNDLIAATALAASGCQIVLFTTGRGTPFSTFVPTMKIASNERLASFKNNWIDFNAYGMDEDGLFALLLKTVNGEYLCKNEDIREIAFYKTGVTL